MQAFSDALCLALWERGASCDALERALLLAAACDDDGERAAWADVPLGARDAHLMRRRCAWFGPLFEGLVDCPSCGEVSAIDIDLSQFSRTLGVAAGSIDASPPCEFSAAGARFRLPTSRDLRAIAHAADVDAAERMLVARLVVASSGESDWSEEQRAEIDDALDTADPGAQILLDLACAECGTRWRAPFDIAASLWDELDSHAQRVVADIHRLASKYGWSERDILAMSASRRRLYLQMIDA